NFEYSVYRSSLINKVVPIGMPPPKICERISSSEGTPVEINNWPLYGDNRVPGGGFED
ncbi:4242_t:CDS:2, partial [Acaulospora morrowiae]